MISWKLIRVLILFSISVYCLLGALINTFLEPVNWYLTLVYLIGFVAVLSVTCKEYLKHREDNE